MRIDGGVTDQFVIALAGIVIIEVDFIKVVGIPMVALGELGRHPSGVAVGSDKKEIVVALLEQHLAEVASELTVVVHEVAFVEPPVVGSAHDVKIGIVHGMGPAQEKVQPGIVGLGIGFATFVGDVDVFPAMDILVGDVGFTRPGFANRVVDHIVVVGLVDSGNVLGLEIEIAEIDAAVLVGSFEHRFGMVFVGNVVGIDKRGFQAYGGIVPATVLPDGQVGILLHIGY